MIVAEHADSDPLLQGPLGGHLMVLGALAQTHESQHVEGPTHILSLCSPSGDHAQTEGDASGARTVLLTRFTRRQSRQQLQRVLQARQALLQGVDVRRAHEVVGKGGTASS